ncbi:SusD/RagB family nutrient-binding outer membrane lipoprotein [Pedobacter foliorum]|uniref:SusD/RagB family nutrient-binding outer membrane lipoprotein n=1 Tax=Pedobacter foliorum TaxID=2739058 RepID=UPI001563CA1B|nr:SusD/RagB family nutrient-binding outer membrane lipoprotein [Pedobacter foliorum]NRF38343.1 SusD/RagB family nutrient-binding outer membrane lipoprotein [Pedobacter foliorum]
MTKKIIYLMVSVIIMLTACKQEKYNKDPNRPTEVGAQAILPNVIFNSFKNRYPWQPGLAVRQATATSDRQAFQTYEWANGDWAEFNVLRDVTKMMESAKGAKEYLAIGKILRAHNFFFLTRMYGSVPYNDALKGQQSNNYQPKYDSQKDIIVGILNELEEANQLLIKPEAAITGDILYNGDLKKWRKLANSYKLRILLMLSKKESDQDLQVAKRFNDIISNPGLYPIFERDEDEAKISYRDYENIRYPLYMDFNVRNKRFIGKTLADLLKRLEDPRLFYYATPFLNAAAQGKTGFDAYEGIDASKSLTAATEDASTGNYSRVNSRNYTELPIGKPSLGFSYAELMLAIAEATERGWVQANAAIFYEHAVQSSFQFYDVAGSAAAYLTKNPLSSVKETALTQLYEQRYILFNAQSDFELFFHYHRTNFPVIVNGQGQATAIVPFRLLYPTDEQRVNAANYKDALKAQGFNADNILMKPWLYQ